MTDEEKITQKIAEIAATADQYPGVIIIHHVPRRTVVYMSPMGLRLLNTTPQALETLGPDYWPTYFNAVESEAHIAQAWKTLEEGDFDAVSSFFQQVRTNEREGWSWYFTSMRLLLCNGAGRPLLAFFLAAPMHPENHFAAKIQRLIDENSFLRQHGSYFASLTPREREVLRYLALGHSSPEIATTLNLSVQTADTHRRNIRQKLKATSAFELGQYARAFDLI